MNKLFATLLALVCMTTASYGQIVINEIMYNPPESGTDSLEFIELYNTSSMSVDVSGWSFSQGVTHTFPSGTTIPANAYYVLAVDSIGFFNAFGTSPDAEWDAGGLSNGGEDIAIIDASGVTIDSVNYDDNTPWQPTNDTLTDGFGYSYELCDATLANADETNWYVSTSTTAITINGFALFCSPGAANSVSCAAPVLTVEFDMNSSTVDESAGTVNIDVMIMNPDANPTSVDVTVLGTSTATGGGTDYTFTNPTTVTFPASSNANQTISITITDDMMQETDETIVLELSNATNGAMIGTDTIYTLTITDNDAPVVAPANLVITEINYNVPGADSVEFVEIYNNDTAAVDLTGYEISSAIFYTFPSITLNMGDYILVTNDSVAFQNAFGIAAYEWNSGNSLNNTGETIELNDPSGAAVDVVSYMSSSPWPVIGSSGGPSIQLCDINTDNALASSWGYSNNATGVFLGTTEVLATPGAANTVCVAPTPTTYTYYSIDDINGNDGNGVPDSSGVTVELRGVVHCGDFASGNSLGFYLLEYDNVGINTFGSSTGGFNYTVREGDSLHVFGTIDQFNGVTQIVMDSISLVDSFQTTVTPMTLTTALSENEENKLIEALNVSLVNPADWTGTGSGFNVDVTDGTNTWNVRIDADVDLYTQPAPTGTFNIYGFGNQFDNSSPYDSGYQLLACNSSITIVNSTEAVNNQVVRIFPNPTSTVLNIQAAQIDAVVITNMLGQEVVRMNNVNNNNLQINTVDLAKGVYNITIVANDELQTKQFVKQ
jgi:hypothetical protein